MKASDLVIVWQTYGYESREARPWPSAICPTCAQTMRVGDDGALVDHMRATDANYEDDVLCAGVGETPEKSGWSQLDGCWQIVARPTGRSLAYFKTIEDARAKLAEMQKAVKSDVTPPGRESQVRALKEKPGIDNPYAVAWASYEGDSAYDGAECEDCDQVVPVRDGNYVDHLAPGGSYGEPTQSATNLDAGAAMCGGSGAICKMDTIEHKGGKWVLLAKSTGKVLGEHATKEEAEAQERAVQASKHGDGDGLVKRWERLDFAPGELPRAAVTADGFLQVHGRVARTGIQEYRDGQGGVRKELRLPDEVRKSLPTFPLQPLTNTHPTEMVDPGNSSKYVKGAVGEAIMQADGWVTAPMKIYSADAIEAARAGRVQLSVGYTCRLETQSGEWQGQKYDAVQRDIVVNHVALVDAARAGDAARLRMDAGDAVACNTGSMVESQHEVMVMAKLTIDGMVFEVQDANAQAALDGFVARVQKDRDEKVAAEKLRADNAEKLRDVAVKEKDGLQGKYDSKMAEDKQPIKLDAAEITVADATDPAKFAAFVQPIVEARATARASLLVEARRHLGANEKFDAHAGKDGKTVAAKTDDEIKRLVIGKLKPSIKLDGKGAEYVQALYDDAVANAKPASPIDAARAVGGPAAAQPQLAGERSDDGRQGFDPDAARRRQDAAILQMNVRHPQHKKGA